MAESQGFEPRDPVKGQRFSRPPHSTALPTLRSPLSARILKSMPILSKTIPFVNRTFFLLPLDYFFVL